MVCASCGTENRPDAKFCGGCGNALARVCPSCGAANDPGMRFCTECGTALAAPFTQAAPAAETAVAERRLVSVLFADLVGFTSLSESRDAEEVRELLSRYFEACRRLIERYGGTVEKFIGDAVMAVWGTPVANEDDAERAVRTALDLIDAVATLGGEVGAADLTARAGVVTGEASVNLGVQGEGMVAGDLVNTASRVQTAAEPGSVLVGDATRRATEAAIVYADAGEHELKGKAEPVHLWRALRVTAGRGGLMRSEGLEPPFVGRTNELRLVKDLFHASAEERRAHLIQVTGIAGIGKSRLAWEFFKYMDGLQRLFFWHRGRCLAYGEGVTYWALAEMLRGRAGILEGEEHASALPKLREAVEAHVADPEERSFVEPRLAQLLGLEDRTTSEKTDLFAGWRLFFERLAEQDPVIMVFEDVQWADASLLEFVDYLLEWSRAYPIFVVTLARPGGAQAPGRNATSIYLEPLPAPAMEELLAGFAPGLPEQLRDKILARAEGVPLYAVETIRMLLDRGLLVQVGPVYEPAGTIEELDVPETLHALIAARLDALSTEERRLVQDASVLGKTFRSQALAALTGLADGELEPLLASLVAKELLSVQADPRSPERGQYGFLQDLVRTVAYETLPRRERKQKHLAAARYLGEAWGVEDDEIVEVVASHYVHAYRLAPGADDAAAIKEKALRTLVRAAERAASLAAATEARAYFAQAAEFTGSALVRAELKERAGQMAFLDGDPDGAAKDFEEAAGLFTEAGQARAAARVEARHADVDAVSGYLERGVDRLRRAHAVLAGAEPDPDLALVTGQLGRLLAVSGKDDEEATAALERALELAEQLQLPNVYSHALSSRGVILGRRSRFDEAATLLRRALEVGLEHEVVDATGRAYNNLAWVWEHLDRHVDVAELTEQALANARRVGSRFMELTWLGGSIETFVELGRWEAALARTQELRSLAGPHPAQYLRHLGLSVCALHVRCGELDRAREVLDAASEIARSNRIEIRGHYEAVLAEALRAEGKAAEALEVAERAVAARELFGLGEYFVKHAFVQAAEAALDLGDVEKADELVGIVRQAMPGEVSPYLRAHAARLASKVAAARGETDSVEQGFTSAAKILRELQMPFDLAVALLEHGEWLVGEGRQGEAEPLLAEAREIFTGLEARPWLERAAAATERHAESVA